MARPAMELVRMLRWGVKVGAPALSGPHGQC